MPTLDERIEAAKALTGYTPGPWRVGIDDDGNPLSGRPGVFSSDELDCGIVHWDGFVQEYWRSARGDKEIHANAHLIAAAPDLHRLALDLDDSPTTIDGSAGASWEHSTTGAPSEPVSVHTTAPCSSCAANSGAGGNRRCSDRSVSSCSFMVPEIEVNVHPLLLR